MLFDREREVIFRINIKLLINKETAEINKQNLERYKQKSEFYLDNLDDLSILEDIKEQLNQLLILHGLIPASLHLANNSLIYCIQECAYHIDKINKELSQRKAADEPGMLVEKGLNAKICKNLLIYTEKFIEEHNKFYVMWQIKNFYR
jgi:hypothetical protein